MIGKKLRKPETQLFVTKNISYELICHPHKEEDLNNVLCFIHTKNMLDEKKKKKIFKMFTVTM